MKKIPILKSVFAVLLTLAVLGALVVVAAPVAAASTPTNGVTVVEGATSVSINTTSTPSWANLAGTTGDYQTVTGQYGSTYYTYSGIPVYVLLQQISGVSSLPNQNYSALIEDNETGTGYPYQVLVGPTFGDKITVAGNNTLIIADQGTKGSSTGSETADTANLLRLVCPYFSGGNPTTTPPTASSAGKYINSNVAKITLEYTVSVASAPVNGAIVPNSYTWNTGSTNPWTYASGGVGGYGVLPVVYNGSQTFNITPVTGYYIASVTADGNPVTLTPYTTTTYQETFSSVTANHTLAATFAALPPTATVSISAPSSETSGTTFNVNLLVNTGTTQIRGWQGSVNFDQTKLKCNSVSAESYLTPWTTGAGVGDSVSTPVGSSIINNTNGTITNLAYVILGTANLGGPSGAGTLITMSFTALANGTASITPTSIVLSDVNGNTLPSVTVTAGSVSIGLGTAEITAYSVPGEVGTATINSGTSTGTIGVNVPFGTNVTNLVATFTLSSGASAAVGATPQVSGTTANNFSTPVAYTVTAQNLATTKTWTVTVTILPSASAEILTYSLPGELGSASINSGTGTIAVSMPVGTDLTALKATFTISTGASITIGSTPQVSGTTANNFSTPVGYTVTAQSLATKAWTLTVTIGGSTGNSTVSGTLATATVSISVPSSLNLGNLKAGWNVTDWGASPGSVTITPGSSGVTSWTVTAQGGAYLMNGNTGMTDPLLIGPSNGAWSCADGTSAGSIQGSNYSGMYTTTGSTASGTFDLWAAQYGASTDSTPGSYSTTITFTATCAP